MSSTTMLPTSYSAARGRECGACTLCCKVYELPELAKAPGVWCKHCAPGKGCAIHEAPPDQCRRFFCLWMTDRTMPAEWKPDRARFVLSIYPTNGFIYGQVDPGSPAAWRKAPYFDGLRAMAKMLLEEKRHLIMFVGDQATLVMPDETLSLGAMTANDNFRIEPAFGPKRPDVARGENMSKVVRLCFGLGLSIALIAPASAELAMTGAPLVMRTGRAGKATVVQRIPQSAEIVLGKCSGNWCRASWRGRVGYIRAEAVVRGPPPATVPGRRKAAAGCQRFADVCYAAGMAMDGALRWPQRRGRVRLLVAPAISAAPGRAYP